MLMSCFLFLLFSFFSYLLSVLVVFSYYSTTFSSLCDIIYSIPFRFLRICFSSFQWIYSNILSILFPSSPQLPELPFFLIPFHHPISLVKNHFLTYLNKCKDSPLFPKAYFHIQFCTITAMAFTAF